MKCFVFPGQGSQHAGMGQRLFDVFSELAAAADAILGYSIRELCLEDPHQRLSQTRFTQPALFVVNAMAARMRQREEHGQPDFVAGHSLGEYNALEFAGAINFEDGLRLVQKRGELMALAPAGGMAAVIGLPAPQVEQVMRDAGLSGIDVANYNAPTQVVISGPRDEVERAQPAYEAAGAMFVPLNVSGAFHSRQMQTAADEFARYLARFRFSQPRIPVIANVTGEFYQTDRIAETLAKQLTRPVRWVDSIEHLLQRGVTDFVEVGPRDVLTKLVRSIRAQWQPAPEPEKSVKPTRFPASEPTAADSQPTAAERVDQWNLAHPVGTRVRAKGYGEPLVTRTRAMVLFGHRAAIYLQGYEGYFALDDLRPA